VPPMQFPRTPPIGRTISGSVTPDELISALQRGAAQGIDPRHILLTLGFRPAGTEAALDDVDEP